MVLRVAWWQGTVADNRCQIVDVFTPVVIRGGLGEICEMIFLPDLEPDL